MPPREGQRGSAHGRGAIAQRGLQHVEVSRPVAPSDPGDRGGASPCHGVVVEPQEERDLAHVADLRETLERDCLVAPPSLGDTCAVERREVAWGAASLRQRVTCELAHAAGVVEDGLLEPIGRGHRIVLDRLRQREAPHPPQPMAEQPGDRRRLVVALGAPEDGSCHVERDGGIGVALGDRQQTALLRAGEVRHEAQSGASNRQRALRESSTELRP